MVANLKRYDLQECNFWCCASMEEDESGEWVKFKEAMEASSNSLQQLKAEIAAIADSVADYTATGADADTVAFIVRYLRQLSAV